MTSIISKFNTRPNVVFLIVLLIGLVLRLLSSVKMGWLAEDVFFIDNIDLWFSENFFKYFFQFQHNFYPPRSPEFGTPPLGMWVQTIGVYFAQKLNFSVLLGARLPNVFLSLGTIVFAYKISALYFNKRVGLIWAFLISVTPSIVAIDSSAHVDPVLAFLLTGGLYFLLKSYRYENYLYLIISSFFFGLSTLTKVYAWVIVAFLAFFVIASFIHRKRIIGYRKFLLCALVVVIIPPLLWAGLRDPDHMTRTIGVVSGVGSFGKGVGTGGLFSEYAGVSGYSIKLLGYNLLMMLGKMLPLSFIGFVMFLIMYASRQLRFSRDQNEIVVLTMSIILLFFGAVHFFGGPVGLFNRILFPSILALLFCAIAIERLIDYFKTMIKTRWLHGVFFAVVIISPFVSILTTSPHFYNAYNNFFIGGVSGASERYRVGHGEGLELAAAWIKDNASNDSIIYAPRVGFMSKYMEDFSFAYAPLDKPIEFAYASGADYIVLHNSFFSGYLRPQIEKDLSNISPIHIVKTGNADYIRIYKSNPSKYYATRGFEKSLDFSKSGAASPESAINESAKLEGRGYEFNIKRNDYVFIESKIDLVESTDGLYLKLTGNKNNNCNFYIDLGQKDGGYYRYSIRLNWDGTHELYIPFSAMQSIGANHDIIDSNFIKLSFDTYSADRDGSITLHEIKMISKTEDQ